MYQMRVLNTLLQRIRRTISFLDKKQGAGDVRKTLYLQVKSTNTKKYNQMRKQLILLEVKSLKDLGLLLNFEPFSYLELEADLKNHSLYTSVVRF